MKIDENHFFRQSIRYLFSSLDIETALSRFREYVYQLVPADALILGVYDPDSNEGKVLAAIYPDEMESPSPVIQMSERLWGWHKDKWHRTSETTYINNLDQEEPEFVEAISLILPVTGSYLYMDLELESQRLGVLIIYAKKKYQYNDDHVTLISSLHDPFTSAIANALKHEEINRLKRLLEDDNEYLNHQLIEMTGDTIIGSDFGLSHVMEMVRQVAPWDSHVLILGETGVGKEVFANAIHNASNRKSSPLIKVNCGAIPKGLVDSELFGHEKGAFTGAVSMKRGRFERANKGTIFLDEIGELPLDAQVSFLRVLQEKEIERVGGTQSIPVDVRVISATHRNLEEMVRKGSFREDLWFRLNVFPIIIPPLRQRPQDIPALIHYFMEKKAKELKIRKPFTLSSEIMDLMLKYSWPGNVRELGNIIERLIITGPDNNKILNVINILSHQNNERKPAFKPEYSGRVEKLGLDQITIHHIQNVLEETNGKVEGPDGAAAWLQLHPSTLRAKMKKLKIPYGRSKS